MRRTYRSKKETASGIERRDLFQNLDEKSSAYDAFSIQNIKQTKRELSCVGSSNALGVASNRVRKKKYVKRIVKDVGTPCRDSASPSAYLTPDKSIRVNKPLDPFDLLLMSSPACHETGKSKIESVTREVNAFDQMVPKKEGRTYTRRKPKVAKKVHYSTSEGSDSDKENSNENLSTSDIRTHKLLVECKIKTPSRKIDESINNIVNNLSLLYKLKNKYNEDDSINKSFVFNRHRLTRNIQSPLLQKSPLCSTPFKVKYRGESIFKFSPIAANKDNSPNYETISEHNNSSQSSIILTNVEKEKTPQGTQEKCQTTSPVIFPIDNINDDQSAELPQPEKEMDEVINKLPEENSEVMVASNIASNSSPILEISSFQNTESEPFLGFSQNAIDEVIAERENLLVKGKFNDSIKDNNEVRDEGDRESFNNSVEDKDYSAKDKNEAAENNSVNNNSLNNTNQENYITQLEVDVNGNCSGINSSNEHVCKEDIITNTVLESNNDDLQVRKESDGSEENDSDISDSNVSQQSEDEDKDSFYDTCASDQSSIHETAPAKKPVVVLQRLNDSLFTRYYEKMNAKHSESDENSDIDDNIESGNNTTSDENSGNDNKESSVTSEFASFQDNDDSKQSSEGLSEIENGVESNISDNEAEKSGHETEWNGEDKPNSNNEEEHCISFVTTRRRNATNNSMISMFNDSYESSSTDCDKTVLSINKVEKAELKNNTLSDETLTYYDTKVKNNKNDDEIIDLNKESEQSDDQTEEKDTRISFVTTRNSNITDRKSSIRGRKSSYDPRKSIILPRNSKLASNTIVEDSESSRMSCFDNKPAIVLQPGKKWERSLSIYRRITTMADHFDESLLEDMCPETKGRKYRQSIISTMEMQEFNSSLHNDSINSRRSTFVSKPSRSTIRIVKDHNRSRLSLCNTTVFDDLTGFLNEECDDTFIELSKLSIADQTHEVTVLDNFHDTPNRIATPRDYVLRRCNQTDPILFDECYPDTVLKNCHKIGEGVYGEVFLWRARDGRARVLKIVPIAGDIKVNGESQKDFHEIISEIVIAMELSALRAPIAEIERHFDEGKDVEALDLHAIENATDVFNEVLAVRCVYGSYPSRLLDLWDLYDECKGSENDNPAILPVDQQYIVLELANAGQDLESYQFNNAEQAYALFLQVAYGLAVAEEAFQFEHRDLHWGNVLIAPTEQKFATFVIRGRAARVPTSGVRATIIDYSLSRVSLRLAAGDAAALYNDLASDDSLFDAVGDYQFQVYRLMRDKLGNDWKNFEPYTNILWLHYTVDKMITALRYKRTNTKIHKHYIDKLKGIKSRILEYGSAAQFVLTDNEI